MTDKFMFLEHTADVKFRAFGSSLEEAFENSARAMFNVMYEEKVKKKVKKKIKVKGRDLENLLYNFLEELLFLLDSKNFFLSDIKVKIDQDKLELFAELSGDDAKNYEANLSVKAITYNEMFVKNQAKPVNKKWVVQAVLDV